MALQGTLDTFELPDVLRLLSSTKKSGRLLLRGERGDGSVWLADGRVVGVQSAGAPGADPDDSLFDMLRAKDGSFAFEPGEEPAQPGAPSEVEPLLAAAEERLAEWRGIEAIVPGLDAFVTLVDELPAPELTIDAGTWKLVATVAGGMTVGDLGRMMQLGEIGVCRVVRDLVTLGLGVVTAAPAAPATPAWDLTPPVPPVDLPPAADAYEPVADDSMAAGWEVAAPSWDDTAEAPSAPVFAVDEPAGYGFEPLAEADTSMPIPADSYDPGAEEADEMARQLAMLSPRAAQAVAAAAAAESDDERDAALQALDDTDEPINRGLLLKFLSSVKS